MCGLLRFLWIGLVQAATIRFDRHAARLRSVSGAVFNAGFSTYARRTVFTPKTLATDQILDVVQTGIFGEYVEITPLQYKTN
jgi:hypothetical protein